MTKKLSEPIAIIGMGAIMPGALDKDTFWSNILNKKSSITEVPPDYWNPAIYYSPDHKATDRTYSKIGGFIRGFRFNAIKHRIPPKIAEQMDGTQHLAIETAHMALADSGYDRKPFDRKRTAVIVGNSMGGMKKETTDSRVHRLEIQDMLKRTKTYAKLGKAADDMLAEFETGVDAKFGVITEDTMPGELSNVIAGRLANVFDFNGTNFSVDAACATSLAAVQEAVNGLRLGNFDLCLCCGVDQMMQPSAYIKFCKIGALSADGSFVFDKKANGFVMGEAAGSIILKRLSDAVRDGDRVYAVIRAVGASSDGKGKGITAPNPKGQKLAIEHAFEQLDYSIADVQLVEAHGTGTVVGDATELAVLDECFKSGAAAGGVGVTSVKSNIGHCKAAAGMASMIKTALALHHKTLPPSINCTELNPAIDWSGSPLRVITEAEPWNTDKTRRANVSAFGFGGTNFHVALEEFGPSAIAAAQRALETQAEQPVAQARPFVQLHVPGEKLQGEAVTLSAGTMDALFAELEKLAQELDTGKPYPLILKAYPLNTNIKNGFGVSLSGATPAHLAENIAYFLKTARTANAWAADNLRLKMKGIYPFVPGKIQPKIGFVFPGQGSQYVDMLKDLASKYRIVQDTFDESDEIMQRLMNVKLTDVIWSRPGETREQLEKHEHAIKQTEMTQPAVLTADLAMMRLITSYGIKPHMLMGHSLGEYAAAVAADIFTFEGGLRAVSTRAKEMASIKVADNGMMASIAAPWEMVQEKIKAIPGYVAVANKNCPQQTVIAGDSKAIPAAIDMFNKQGIQAVAIPVSHAFHSKIIEPATVPYREFLKKIPVNRPQLPVFSNVTALPYPDDPDEIRELLAVQVCHTVEWISQLNNMYDQGVRLFVECGPKRVLSAFATATLADKKDIRVLATNHPKKGGIAEFNDLLANLMSSNIVLDWQGKDILKPGSIYTPSYEIWAKETAGLAASVPALPAQPAAPAPAPVADSASRFGFNTSNIGISGIAAGTPGSWDKAFREGNIDEILRGQNLIEPVSHKNQQSQIDKNVEYVVKAKDGNHRIEKLTDVAQAVKLAAQKGKFELSEEFGLPEKWARSMDNTFRLAIGAGLLALKDAGIPLVMYYKRTSTGGYLPEKWGLPKEMIDDTGVIFASAFPSTESVIKEVSGYLTAKFRTGTLADIETFYNTVISEIKSPETRAKLSRWYAENFARYHAQENGAYKFSTDFLLKAIPLGHSQFCQWINARGPATHVSAACSSTTQAVGIAEDWIRTGRARRIIIISADDVTTDIMQEWVLAGFLATGAATTAAVVSQAALPFDKRRHGMIVGMGAAALVVEDETSAARRGVKPLARVLGTEIANSAFHPTRLDVNHVSDVMERLVAKVERRYGFNRLDMAKNMMFMSHETYTPAKGGSASAEVNALKETFGPGATDIIVSNTKGFTGHAMGAGLEDVVSVRALTTGRVPPIANYQVPDPELAGINLSKGGKYNFKYALRLAAGFGSQLAMTVTERLCTDEESRIADSNVRESWLRLISGQNTPELEIFKNTLRVKDAGIKKGETPAVVIEAPQAFVKTAPAALPVMKTPASAPMPAAVVPEAEKPAAASAAPGANSRVEAEVLDLVSEKTGYPKDMLELDLDMEADLGIDTVKQAELFVAIREKYSIPQKEGVKLKDYPTIRHCINFVLTETGQAPSGAATATAAAPAAPAPAPAATPPAAVSAAEQAALTTVPRASGSPAVEAEVLDLVSEKTGYPKDMLELDLDMEADLGIDTVKQAELFVAIREKYSIPQREGIQLKDYPTIRHCINFVLTETGQAPSGAATATAAAPAAPAPAPAATPPAAVSAAEQAALTTVPRASGSPAVEAEVLDLVSEKTGYPKDMLELDLDMEADLGIDTVKQAELFVAIREKYSIPQREGIQLKDYPTIRHCINFVLTETGQAPSGAATATAAAPAAPAPAPATAPPAAVSAATPVASSATPATAVLERPAVAVSAGAAKVEQAVIELVSEKTGYPKDMLELDLDMEADLGIDTVKQAELFVAIREKYSIPQREGIQLKDYPTIRHCINFVLQETAAPAQDEKPATHETAALPVAQQAGPEPGRCIRLVPVTVEAPLTEEFDRKIAADRPVLLFSDNAKLTKAFQHELQKFAVPVHVFTSQKTRSKNTVIVNWDSIEDVEKNLREFAAENPDVQGIISLLGCQTSVLDLSASAHNDMVRYVMPYFLACKVFEKALANQAGADTFISINITLDGAFGFRTGKPFDPFYGAIAGTTQCLRKDMYELAKTRTKLIDCDPSLSPAAIAEQTVHEIMRGDDRMAIGFHDSLRTTYFAVSERVDTSKLRYPLDGKTFIVTGGGRGLGALFSQLAAKRAKVRVLVFDILELTDDTPKYARMNEAELAELKQSVWNRLKADSSVKATPVLLEREYARLTDPVTLHNNLQKLRTLGSEAEYYRCDVTDGKAIAECVKKIKARYGQIDGIVHFAGLERSKLVSDKTVEEFYRIFDVKADSAMKLAGSGVLKKGGFWVSASSIAGKFGNLGQSDYACANDYIAKLAVSLQNSGYRGVSAAMTAYGGTGMALRPGVKTFLESNGVDFIYPEEGMTAILDELMYSARPEIVLSGSLGKLDTDSQLQLNFFPERGSGGTKSDAGETGVPQQSAPRQHAAREENPGRPATTRQEDQTKEHAQPQPAKRRIEKPQLAETALNEPQPARQPEPAAEPGADPEVTASVLAMISDKTGYPKDMLELDLDMEADLGIDTVKQAELFVAIREHYGIGRREGVQLKDYPTIRHCINYVLAERAGDSNPSSAQAEPPGEQKPEPEPEPAAHSSQLTPEPVFRHTEKQKTHTEPAEHTAAQAAVNSGFPFLERETAFKKNQTLKTSKTFSIETDPYLADHSIADTPYVPGVIGIETFFEAAARLGGERPQMLRNIRFSLPIKLLRNRPQPVRINAERNRNGITMEIESDFINAKGVRMGAPRRHFSAATAENAALKWKSMPKPEFPQGKPLIDKAGIYKLYFHGPSFQVLDQIHSIGSKSVSAVYRRPQKPLWADGNARKLLAHPLLIEAAFQTCGFRDLNIEKRMALPDAVGLVYTNPDPDVPETLYVYGEYKGRNSEGRSVYNAYVYGKNGTLWAELQDYQMIAQ
ncbi:MAG: SDR family NAD(P)-dependent oxidoreductase [Elusimicrobiaceae bacterium]|nr:SDR family NAD(P)-dependent oxidoreductase [Elusimicrobiaceae bacterium]